jgi:hypothetical protein|tara:strand:+ start:377 stop:610 length:234 start_codon:yes stop_codon:yes gene_type:complete
MKNNFENVREQITNNMITIAEDLNESCKNGDWESVLLASMGIVKLMEITNPHLFGKVRLMLDGSESQTSIENRDMFL